MAVTVEHIISHKGANVLTVPPTMTLGKAASLMAEHNVGAVVVSSDGQTVEGILSERDIVRRFAKDDGVATSSVAVATVMTRDVETATLATAVNDLVKTMTNGRFRHVPIVQDGLLVGIVSIGDVVKVHMVELEVAADALKEYVTGTSY